MDAVSRKVDNILPIRQPPLLADRLSQHSLSKASPETQVRASNLQEENSHEEHKASTDTQAQLVKRCPVQTGPKWMAVKTLVNT